MLLDQTCTTKFSIGEEVVVRDDMGIEGWCSAMRETIGKTYCIIRYDNGSETYGLNVPKAQGNYGLWWYKTWQIKKKYQGIIIVTL